MAVKNAETKKGKSLLHLILSVIDVLFLSNTKSTILSTSNTKRFQSVLKFQWIP